MSSDQLPPADGHAKAPAGPDLATILLAAVSQHSRDAVYARGPDGRFLVANGTFADLFGLTPGDLVGKAPNEVLPPATVKRFEEGDEAAREARAPISTEEALPDARPLQTLLWTRFPVFSRGPEPVAVAGVGVEVSAEKELRFAHQQRSEALMRLYRVNILRPRGLTAALQEITRVAAKTLGVERVGVWLLDETRRSLECVCLYEASKDRHTSGMVLRAGDYPAYWRAFERQRVVSADDAYTDPATCEFGDDYLTPFGIVSMLDAPLRAAAETVGVVCHEHVGGPRHWTSADQVFAASIADLVSNAIQTHRALRAEEAVRVAREGLELAASAANLGLWDLDVATGALRLDARAAEMLAPSAPPGAPPAASSVDAKPPTSVAAWAERAHPDDRFALRAAFDGHLEGRADHLDLVHRVPAGAGRERHIQVRGRVVSRDQADRPTRAAGILQDVSEVRRLEDRLLQAEKLELVGRLAGGLAHDLNNVLTAVVGFADLLSTTLAPGSETHRWSVEIGRAGRSATALTSRLLAHSRVRVRESVLTDWSAAVAEIEPLLRRLLPENMTLEIDCAPPVCHVRGDPAQLGQVVLNLAVNARDAMPDGGRLRLRTSTVEVEPEGVRAVGGLAPGRYAMLEVVDAGAGIDPGLLERIFEPFFTTKAPGHGTGLGLTLVRSVAEEARGRVEIESLPGNGTTVRVLLPAAAAPVQLPASAAGSGSPRGNGETVLVVEDVGAARHLACEALERGGYVTLEADGAPAALAWAERVGGRIDLVLMDVVLPGLSGRRLADRLQGLCPNAVFLFVSGYADEEVLRQGVEAGTVAFLAKPYSVDALLAHIRGLLSAPPGARSRLSRARPEGTVRAPERPAQG